MPPPVSPLAGKTTNWRAGCGRSACPVRREGDSNAIVSPYPYQRRREPGATTPKARPALDSNGKNEEESEAMTKLSRIELLDQQFPGLADRVRKWFAEGVSCQKIAALLVEQYGAAARTAHSTVGSFRLKRWVPEQRLLQQRKIEILARQQVAQEREMRATLAREFPREAR